MEMPREIQTESLLLRAIEPGDARLMFDSYAQDPDVARYISWRITGKIEDTAAFVNIALGWWAEPETANEFVYSVFIAQSGDFIGCCSAGRRGHPAFHWVVGYNFAKRFWGKGYATEAISALTKAAAARPEVLRISAIVDTDNPASARVLEKCGYLKEGVLRKYSVHPNISEEPRDCFLYALTK